MKKPFFYAGPFSACVPPDRGLYEGIEIEMAESTFNILKGPSGCGKSTLLHQIVGMKAAKGAKRILGGESFDRNMLPEWRSKVTIMMQNAPLLTGTVRENLAFPFRLKNSGGRTFHWNKARWLMHETGLDHVKPEQDAKMLSGGERHRLALVRALLWSPTVILADEPLGGLDEAIAQRCLDLLQEYSSRPGKAVLCVLHNFDHLEATGRTFNLP